MLSMENSSRYNRAHAHSSFKQWRSGYEPSDTESEWEVRPWHERRKDNNRSEGFLVSEQPKSALGHARNISPLSRSQSQRYSLKPDYDLSPPTKISEANLVPRSSSKSLYKPRINDSSGHSPKLGSHPQRNDSSLFVSEHSRHCSPYEERRDEGTEENDELKGLDQVRNQKSPHKFMESEGNRANRRTLETPRLAERSKLSRRCVSAPKLRPREKEQQIQNSSAERRINRSPPPLVGSLIQKPTDIAYTKAPSTIEVNEMIANVKLSKAPLADVLMMESTESIAPGDIFFSREASALQKKAVSKNTGYESSFIPEPKVALERKASAQEACNGITGYSQNPKLGAVSASQKNLRSSSLVSRQSSKSSNESRENSKMTDGSGMLSENFRKFTADWQRKQKATWFSCVRTGSCRRSKSPENREIYEASFIERAFVVENLRHFWADKHQPHSLSGFICHKQQAQHLKQLISHNNCPHILLRGPSGSGKKALSMALLGEIFGASAWKISNDLRYLQIQDNQPVQVVIPVTSSPHHVELNLKSASENARYALMSLVKEITSNHAPIPEFSDVGLKAAYKVIVLYKVDKLADNMQHLIKWIMDCYTDACKIVLCCEDESDLLESIKSRCVLIEVDAPVTHEIMEVLIQIARKENFDLPLNFAAKIAAKSKQNLRNAIMALEACKAHNYPFLDEQPIPLNWEEVLVELAEGILADPSPKKLFFSRGKIQQLLADFVHPNLILLKLAEQFLKGIDVSLKRELYYWHAYYDKRLPTGTGALLKLEEFLAKFMSIQRKSFSGSRPFL